MIVIGEVTKLQTELTEGTRKVIAERTSELGFIAENSHGELLEAARTYLLLPEGKIAIEFNGHLWWPKNWKRAWYKPESPIRDLVKAAALIIAEIDRRIALGETE